LDLAILKALGDKTVMLGVLDVGSNRVESVAALARRGRKALEFIQKDHLILAPDCGMFQLSRRSSKKKLANMVKAAKILNES
jgi:5-methyltetrahydropteroyltriglutamate--homocysteine methyltransferase